MKDIIIIGGAGSTNIAVREAISRVNHENKSIEVINLSDVEESELKTLADQLNALSERENRVMKSIDEVYELSMIKDSEIPYIDRPSKGSKGYKQPYKFHK